MDLSFKEYYEKQPTFLNTIQDELGIDPQMLEKNPQWAANVKLGNMSYNGMMYKIVKFIYKDGKLNGALVQPQQYKGVHTQRAYIGHDGKQIRSPDNTISSRPIYITIDKLNNMLTQGIPATGDTSGGMLPGGM